MLPTPNSAKILIWNLVMNEKDDKKEFIDESDCLQAMDHLYAYLSGEVKDKETLDMMEHHLGHCKSCYSRAEIEKEINNRLQQTSPVKAPETLRKKLDDILNGIK